MNKTLPIVGYNDLEISYDELTQLAFSIETDQFLADHYKQVLISTQNALNKYETVTWDRFIFCMDPKTRRVRTWLD